MKVKDNYLFDDNSQRVRWVKSPNTGGLLKPTYGIIHYDAAPNETSAINWMASPTSKVSAHLHISRTGKITQLVPFNVVAWHAGASSWKGLSGMNSHSIGIELQNTGSQEYTDIQMQVLGEVVRALNIAYPIKEWTGHSNISPGRKQDPGPQFDWALFDRLVAGYSNCKDMRITTADLNMRSGGSTQHTVITTLPKGTSVQILSSDSDWSVIFIPNTKQTGWVNNKYLK